MIFVGASASDKRNKSNILIALGWLVLFACLFYDSINRLTSVEVLAREETERMEPSHVKRGKVLSERKTHIVCVCVCSKYLSPALLSQKHL